MPAVYQINGVSSKIVCISTNPSSSTKFLCFCGGSSLVKPSAIILLVSSQATYRSPACVRSRSQCCEISTWRSFVDIRGSIAVSRRIVCRLSLYNVIFWPVEKPSLLNNVVHYMDSFPACSRARSSASVINVMTVACFRDDQSITPPKSLNVYPWTLRLSGLLANDASAEILVISFSRPVVSSPVVFVAEYSIARCLVLYR